MANNGNNIRVQHLKVNLKENFIYVSICSFYYTKMSQKIIKTFLIEDFFHLSPVSMTLVVYLELRVYPQIFGEKIEMALMV